MNFQGIFCTLKLKKNLHRLKDGGRTWWQHCSKGLADMGFKQREIDQCACLRCDAIIVYYADDCITLEKYKKMIKTSYDKLSRKFIFTEDGDVSEFLGIKIKYKKDRPMRMSQPHLIRRMIETIPETMNTNTRETKSLQTSALTKDVDSEPRKGA